MTFRLATEKIIAQTDPNSMSFDDCSMQGGQEAVKWAMTACPREIPPSLQGTSRWVMT
jgi:hypothetical protein